MSEYSLKEAFPEVESGAEPFGHRIVVQLRSVKKRSAGGIHLPSEAREAEKWNTVVAKVIKVGPVAFHDRETMQPWPEGVWAQPGDFVRVPKYGGDRWEVEVENGDDALFAIFNDHELIAKIHGDPLAMKVFI